MKMHMFDRAEEGQISKPCVFLFYLKGIIDFPYAFFQYTDLAFFGILYLYISTLTFLLILYLFVFLFCFSSC